MRASHILGLNSRNHLYLSRYNSRRGREIADSKFLTKKLLRRHKLPHPRLLAYLDSADGLAEFDWNKLTENFVIKPASGYAGEGIVLVRKRIGKDEVRFQLMDGSIVTLDDLKLHILDILSGRFDKYDLPGAAMIEDRVKKHPRFKRYAYQGTPDIRVIVFNKVPVMAMLRLPTPESSGRANLHQGAIAVGIDLATGITTKAFWHGNYIRYKPGTKRKLHGIRIPTWTKILETAVSCQEPTGLGYFGADIVLHPEKGPMILELNFQPGLSIQLANSAGLRKRLERIRDLEVKDAEHGVKIAKILFAERFADRVKVEEGIKILKTVEKVKIYTPKKKARKVEARIDTGALRSSIDRNLAEELGLLDESNILWKKRYAYRSAHGKQARPVIGLNIRLAGRKIKTSASVANRSRLSTPILIGRRDLQGFLIDSTEAEI